MVNRFWTKIFTHFPWNCLMDYNSYYYFYYLHNPMSVHHYYFCIIVITVKLSQFDNASSWNQSLFVKIKLWICCKYLRIFLQHWLSQQSNCFLSYIQHASSAKNKQLFIYSIVILNKGTEPTELPNEWFSEV